MKKKIILNRHEIIKYFYDYQYEILLFHPGKIKAIIEFKGHLTNPIVQFTVRDKFIFKTFENALDFYMNEQFGG